MTKTTGLGDNFYIGGYDLSGYLNSLSSINGGPNLLDFTTIDKSAMARLMAVRQGGMQFTTFMSDAGGPTPLQNLPTTDTIGTYCRGTTLGNPGACCNAKQVNFDPTRGNDAALSAVVSLVSNAYGLEWGEQLTAGLRTDATATSGTTVDDGAGTALGAQAYLQVTAFSGTGVDIIVEHSTDNSSWSTLIDFGTQNAIGASRVATSLTATVNRYVRASTGTGTFSSVTFSVVFVRNLVAVTF